MLLCGFENLERIIVHPYNNLEESHWIDLIKDKDEPVFYVTCCCNEDWEWEFDYSKTNYERVKHIIIDCIFECNDMEALMDDLDEIFEEIVYGSDEEIKEDDEIDEDEEDCYDDDECCGCCGYCDRCEYAN